MRLFALALVAALAGAATAAAPPDTSQTASIDSVEHAIFDASVTVWPGHAFEAIDIDDRAVVTTAARCGPVVARNASEPVQAPRDVAPAPPCTIPDGGRWTALTRLRLRQHRLDVGPLTLVSQFRGGSGRFAGADC